MKKFFGLLAACLLASASSMAAWQYGDALTLVEKGRTSGSLVVNSTSNLTLNFISTGVNAGNLSDITKWNTLTVQATGADGQVRSTDFAIGGSTLNIGTVNAGETLEFILSGPLSAASSEFDHFWGTGWDNASGSYEYLVFGVNYDANGRQYSTFALQVQDGGSPSGQPLPGVLAVLLCGGGALGAWRLRNRRKKGA